jgi:MauM/NapG family ferredoxin protein
MNHDDPKSGRRDFFRNSFARLMKPLAEYLDERFSLSDNRHVLRPPGAIAEKAFLETCYRCGTCADICPAQAIILKITDDPAGSGTPVIEPDSAACVVCDGLLCTHHCPSGALQPLTSPLQIRMGLAVVNEDTCVRTHGEECGICVEHCPIGPSAIQYRSDSPPIVFENGCTGCGICQRDCPTTPKSIVVNPI